MPTPLHYPDLAAPPAGWTYLRVGSQVRLTPPGNGEGAESAAIVISPLVARHKQLPPIERIIAMAIDTEAKTRLTILERSAPVPARTTTGLTGSTVELRGEVGGAIERRVYTVYTDALCCYGISYVAGDAVYDKYLKLFLEAARSMKPFQGRVMGQGGGAEERSLHSSYGD